LEGLPEARYSHSSTSLSSKTRIRQNGAWASTFLMNPAASSGWPDYAAKRAAGLIAQSGYDGVYVDVLGPAPLSKTYVTALPINPATKKVWTTPDWLKATTGIASTIRTKVSPRQVIGNGLQTGAKYFEQTT